MRAARAGLVLAIVLTAIVAVPTSAQTAASSFAELRRQSESDQRVYVQTAEVADEHGRGIKGKVLELSGSTLRLLVKGEVREFSERDVLIVSERHTSAAKGALIGVAIGGGLGLVGFAAGCREPKDAESCAWARFVLMLGTGAGAVVGAEIGHSIEHERVLFLAPDLKQSHLFTMTPFVSSNVKGLAATLRF
jgi:hypothetical protein